ncbi:MAG: hypothetical protein F4X91_10805 [Nitrospinae bacterium]|nr:hypothetical protein [Nitrospinota bacterium]
MVGNGFETAARSFAKAYKSPHLRLLLVDDTVAHQGGDALMRMAKSGVDTVATEWMNTANGGEAAVAADDPIERILSIAGDPIGANQALFDLGATDGLPVIPPTLDMVERFVAASGRKADEVIARLMPRMADITVERVAANAVMAGCAPGVMPILVTAVQAMGAEEYHVNHVITTAHTLFPIVVVSGPIAREVGMSDGRDLSAEGWGVNAAIGRAVKLIMFNCIGDLGNRGATCQGHFAKYFDAITENVEQTPWEPLHVEKGFAASDSVVTVFTAEPLHMVDDHSALTAQGILGTFGTVAACSGTRPQFGRCEIMLIFGPTHANKVAEAGFDKKLVRDYLCEVHRIPVHTYPPESRERWSEWKQMLYGVNTMENATLPIVEEREDITILVHGGAGPNSLLAPGALNHRSVTRKID